MEKEALYGLHPLFDGILRTLMCQNLILIMDASFKLSYFLILIFFFYFFIFKHIVCYLKIYLLVLFVWNRETERSWAMSRCALRGQLLRCLFSLSTLFWGRLLFLLLHCQQEPFSNPSVSASRLAVGIGCTPHICHEFWNWKSIIGLVQQGF